MIFHLPYITLCILCSQNHSKTVPKRLPPTPSFFRATNSHHLPPKKPPCNPFNLNKMHPKQQPNNTQNSTILPQKQHQFYLQNGTTLLSKQYRNNHETPQKRCKQKKNAPSTPPPSSTTAADVSAAAPCRHCRSFLIVVAAFGSSWVKKGDGGLGLRWWWLRV